MPERTHHSHTRARYLGFVLLVTTLLWTSAAMAAEHVETVTRSFDGRSGRIVQLENLAGFVLLEGGGGEIQVEAKIHGLGDSDAKARQMAQQLEITFEERGDDVIVRANYPVREYSTYHYPGRGGRGGSSSTKYHDRRVKVVSKAKRGAAGLWADFVVRLPNGVGAAVRNAVGDVEAQEVNGPVGADTSSGRIQVEGGEGAVHADTGSGAVVVRNRVGDVHADTGSGSVKMMAVTGSVNADTGSGSVVLEDVEGNSIRADTGSGGVTLRQVRGEIDADTGSGRVDGEGLVARGRLRADTGSGGIDLAGDFTQVDSVELDAGSGSVRLTGVLPGMDLEVSTGSGGIDVNVSGLDIREKSKDELRARSGDGRVPVRIDTGSGSVRIQEGG